MCSCSIYKWTPTFGAWYVFVMENVAVIRRENVYPKMAINSLWYLMINFLKFLFYSFSIRISASHVRKEKIEQAALCDEFPYLFHKLFFLIPRPQMDWKACDLLSLSCNVKPLLGQSGIEMGKYLPIPIKNLCTSTSKSKSTY